MLFVYIHENRCIIYLQKYYDYIFVWAGVSAVDFNRSSVGSGPTKYLDKVDYFRRDLSAEQWCVHAAIGVSSPSLEYPKDSDRTLKLRASN